MLRSISIKNKARLLFILFSLTSLLALVPSQVALANSTGNTGQPNQSCQVSLITPGNAANARGSAFNPNGIAGMNYAGTQPQNSKNPNSVAQYDVACFQQAQH